MRFIIPDKKTEYHISVEETLMQASMIHSDEQQGSITTKKTLFDFKLSQ
jgi:hypothetical protein